MQIAQSNSPNEAVQITGRYGISPKFLSVESFELLKEYTQRRGNCYVSFCQILNNFYTNVHSGTIRFLEDIEGKKGSDSELKNIFYKFVWGFMNTLKEVSAFKIHYFNEIRNSVSDSIYGFTEELIMTIKEYSKNQQQFIEFQKKYGEQLSSFNSILSAVKKEIEDPVYCYDGKHMRHRIKQLGNSLNSYSGTYKQMVITYSKVQDQNMEFQKKILFYRQKVLSSKYKIHKKMLKTAQSLRQCLVQTLVILCSKVEKHNKRFQTDYAVKQNAYLTKWRQKVIKPEEAEKMSSLIIAATKQYIQIMDQIEFILNSFVDWLAFIQDLKKTVETEKVILEELNKHFETHESPAGQMMKTLHLFRYCCEKFGTFSSDLYLQMINLKQLKQEIRKHSEITLSLMKCSQGKPKEINYVQLGQFFQQMSNDFLKSILRNIYAAADQNFHYLKDHLCEWYHKKQKNTTEDSMELSHIIEDYHEPVRQPSVSEAWLWNNWKHSFNLPLVTSDSKDEEECRAIITKFTQAYLGDDAKEIERYTCNLLLKKEQQGVLKVTATHIIFESLSKSIMLAVPLSHIDEVSVKVKLFEKELNLEIGDKRLVFGKFGEITRAHVFIQSKIKDAESKKPKKLISAISLSEQQLAFIKNRREKIADKLEPLTDYLEKCQAVIENVTISMIYDMIYSDKPQIIKGKQEINFVSYFLKKNGGSNIVASKYQPAGPKYYTNNQQITFLNCELISSRDTKYLMQLPKSSFTPKECWSVETQRIYWISHEEFDYLITCKNLDISYSDSFHVNVLHKITKKTDKSVQIRVYAKVVFSKNVFVKGIIESTAQSSISTTIKLLMNEIQRYVKSGGVEEEEKKTDKTEKSYTSKQSRGEKVSKLENQNKILIGLLVFVLLLNVILKLF